jgi:hypothetical protein
MVNNAGTIVPTRQIIRFVSLASLATGPALSEFEMSWAGRNWAKLGKKLLQANVTPLANQLVSTTDSVLGPYSNQGGSACALLPAADRSASGLVTAAGKPGLCISYPGLIRRAFYDSLWNNATQHLNGCYTDGNLLLHPLNQCAASTVAIPVLNSAGTTVVNSPADPFDNYVLSVASGPAAAANTNQFTQMEANLSLFFGLSIHSWGLMLTPDDTPLDRFFDANPDSFVTFGESGEQLLVEDLLRCDQTGGQQPCFTEVANFKRDPGVIARYNCPPENPAGCTSTVSGGTRVVSDATVDPLMGLDFFLGSNMSLKNPNFRSLRCGECHAGGNLTDATFSTSHQTSFIDFIQEFFTGQPGTEKHPEPIGRDRVISGFALEGELSENAQDALERNVLDFCTVGPICTSLPATTTEFTPAGPVTVPVNRTPVGGFPQGMGMLDNGMYNLGVTPIGNDISRGGTDAFGWPLSLARLALKNLGGVGYSPGGDNPLDGFAQPVPGIPLPTFTPTAADPISGGLFDPTPQDQQINPGFGEEPSNPLLPPYLAPWASNVPVGDETQQDELFFGLNTLMREPMLEGFIDAWGPFNPAAVIGENFNMADQPLMAAWPNYNRVNAQGAFKAPTLRNVGRTGPYFHNGGRLTLRQQLDFYVKGGDFPATNSAHRDFLIMNLSLEDEALGGCVLTVAPIGRAAQVNPDGTCPVNSVREFTDPQKEQIQVSIIDFLLELTDDRVDFQRAPFDQPEIFVPLDGTAPNNNSLAGTVSAGRQGFVNNTLGDCGAVPLAGACFRQVPVTGAAGVATRLPNFLNVADTPRLVGGAASCGLSANNHYCH